MRSHGCSVVPKNLLHRCRLRGAAEFSHLEAFEGGISEAIAQDLQIDVRSETSDLEPVSDRRVWMATRSVLRVIDPLCRSQAGLYRGTCYAHSTRRLGYCSPIR